MGGGGGMAAAFPIVATTKDNAYPIRVQVLL